MSTDRPIGLALSGGGYRASLFHLGAMRRLNELGLLAKVGRISSVSGGSILSGFIAEKMLSKAQVTPQFDDWEEAIARDFRKFVGKDIRTYLIARYFIWNAFFPKDRAEALARVFEERLTNRMLTDLPGKDEGTSFIFSATDFEKNAQWRFEKTRVGSYKKGWYDSEGISIGRAVAASASFPPVFGPIRFPVKKKSGTTRIAWLSDGGVYDNLGIESVWKKKHLYNRVLVSDGGASLDEVVPKRYGARLLRYSSIAMDQVRGQRQRWFIESIKSKTAREDDYNGTIWRNVSKFADFKKKAKEENDEEALERLDEMKKLGWYGYDDSENGTVDTYIGTIRTDLDRFTTAEAKILENHGYFNADIGLRTFLPEMLDDDKAPFLVPNNEPNYLDDSQVRKHLNGSGSRWKFVQRYFKE